MEKIDLKKIKEGVFRERGEVWRHCQKTGKIRKFVDGKEKLTSLGAV